MKQSAQRVTRTPFGTAAKATVAAVVAAPAAALADIPGQEGIGDAFSSLQSAGGDMIGDAWPVMVAIVGGLALMKIGKKVISRAT